MRSLVIGLDADGVLLDYLPAWLNALKERTGYELRVSEVRQWDITNYLPKNLHKELYAARTPALYRTVKPIPGAVAGYHKLLARGHCLVVITSDRPNFVAEKKSCIERYFPVSRIVLAEHGRKRDTLRADIFIDDALANDPDILFDQPWNREVPHPGRVLGWTELVARVDFLARRHPLPVRVHKHATSVV